MKKQGLVTAIDVGTTKICTIVSNVEENGKFRIIGSSCVPSTGMHKGLVVNIKEAAQSIQSSVRKAELMSGRKIESAYIGVTGRHITSVNNRGAISINKGDKTVRTDDLKRVMKNAQNIKVPEDRRLLHVIPRGYALDGQTGVKNPVGMHGQRLDVETHIITTAVTSVQNVIRCVRSVGVEVDDVVLEPLASSEAVLTAEEKQSGVILADIGGGTTDVAIFRDGSIWHTAVIPVAGYQLTRDIAMGLGLPFDLAEDMKKRYASVMPVYEGKRQAPEEMLHDSHGVSYQDLCDIVRARIEEIVRLVMLELPQTEYEQLVPMGLVFTGGSSNLSGIDVLARDMIRLPVRVGSPLNLPGVPENLRDPRFSTAVGLVLWAAKSGETPLWQSKRLGFLRIFSMVSRLKKLLGRR
ncbi:MAG TPA: cell division protein FtsA [Dehalococcoidales bacterium]|nr:cell division protein FtsA [Dehalococcoidales bacterium]